MLSEAERLRRLQDLSASEERDLLARQNNRVLAEKAHADALLALDADEAAAIASAALDRIASLAIVESARKSELDAIAAAEVAAAIETEEERVTNRRFAKKILLTEHANLLETEAAFLRAEEEERLKRIEFARRSVATEQEERVVLMSDVYIPAVPADAIVTKVPLKKAAKSSAATDVDADVDDASVFALEEAERARNRAFALKTLDDEQVCVTCVVFLHCSYVELVIGRRTTYTLDFPTILLLTC